MKKRVLLIAIMLVCILALAVACNGGHTHNFSDEWSKDGTGHWHKCESCDEITDKAPHNYGDDDICDDCGYKKGSSVTPPEHKHEFSNEWTKDETSHWHKCESCDEITGKAPHNYGDDDICDDCEYKKGSSVTPPEHKHEFSNEWTKDETSHWHKCESCDEITGKAPHNYGDDDICDDCGYKKESSVTPPEHKHEFSNEWTNDGTGHWHKCESCDEITDKAPHNYGDDNICDDCEYKKPSEGLAYEYDKGTDSYIVTGIGSCNDNEIVIPGTYDNKPVISIGERSFEGCENLTSIEIPNSVTSIGNNAFSGCSNLTSIVIPNSVTNIGDSAFSGCRSLTSIIIPNSVTSIGYWAFLNCTNLASIEIPNSVTSIGYRAFYDCDSLKYNTYNNAKYLGNKDNQYLVLVKAENKEITECKINEKTKFILNSAFYGCSSITSIEIPNSVTSIGDDAFSGCSGLTSIEIPNSVTSIGWYAFSGCTNLTSIEIPNSVTSIGNSAFNGCDSLKYNIYNNAKYLGNKDDPYLVLVKADNKEITECEINEKAKFILNSAFNGCSSLTSIEIPSCVTYIGYSAFYGCDSLQSVTFEGESQLQSIGDDAFKDCSSLISIEIPNSVTSIGDGAFSGCTNLTSIEIPNSVTSVGLLAFYNCSSITSIEIPNSVTSIGDYAFSDCESLTSIEIPNSVTSIGEYTFYDCTNLTSIVIPNSVTSIEWYAFSGCSRLQNVYFQGTIEEWCKIDFKNEKSNPLSNGAKLYIEGREVNELSLPEGVTEIKDWTFYCCTNLTSIEIPNSVTSIGDYAFSGCDNLKSVIIGNSVTSIGRSAFYGCSNLTSVYYHGTAEEWNGIEIDDYNDDLLSATRYYYSANDPRQEPNYDPDLHYWYRDGDEIKIWE